MLTRAEVSRLCGVPESTLIGMHKAGHLPSTGQMTEMHVLALSVARGLRARGLPLKEAGQVLDYLWWLHRETAESHFAQGRRYIAFFRTQPCNVLVSKEAVSQAIDVKVAHEAGLLPVLVDVEKIWHRILEEVAKLRPDAGRTQTAGEKLTPSPRG